MKRTRPMDGRERDRHTDGQTLDDGAAAHALLVHELLEEGPSTHWLTH